MQKNRYLRRAKVTEAKFRHFLKCFALDMEATKIAVLTGLNRNTVNRLAKVVRVRIAEGAEEEVRTGRTLEQLAPPNSTRRFRGRQVLAWLLAENHVYLRMIVDESNIVRIVDAVDAGETPPVTLLPESRRVPPAETETTRSQLLDYFWSHTQLRLAKFKGTSRQTLELHLKESEFRFNHRRQELYPLLLRLMRSNAGQPQVVQN